MATVIQKNGLKLLSNGNALAHKVQNINHFEEVKEIIEDENTEINEISSEQCELKNEKYITDETIEEPEIDIVINNVVCSFSVRCHLNLREIALSGANVEYRKENGMVTMKLRRPNTTASIWSSGKITCTGATSEIAAKQAARRFARCLQKLGFNVKFNNYRVVNVLGTCSMPFSIKISSFSEHHREADYEPELHPGVTYKLKSPKATLKIFSTGSVTVTAPSVADIQAAIEYIFPLVYEFRKERTKEEREAIARKKLKQMGEIPWIDYDDQADSETMTMCESNNVNHYTWD
ncbi:TATA box-binding protein-like 1 [Diorhabda carinulata]|uniref:TATA box-binding protein-like 1 n=1 Tax=Diorhabda sublineata TaxID=1163346 RepID=UPI0024E0C4D3|nr:TATA box-binding protein-like 1 [Diorhabda sublineata]XP_057664572.1 TATA box-binding protein-like 1 [Diorhabda carinulata]